MEYDYQAKCEMILEWAKTKRFFDTSIVEGILDWISEHEITYTQIRAIDNIIDKFKIDI